jgi:hypothetical protein
MNSIVFTPQELINIILAVCAGIITVSGALTSVIKVVQKVHEPEEEQDARIKSLEAEVSSIQERLKLGNRRFEVDAEHLEKIDQSNVITQRALLALLSHSINGNDIDSLKRAKTDLEEYLTENKYETKKEN